jgi:hypothetical protein
MSPEFWAIIAIGIGIYHLNYVAATENEKRLDRIAKRLDDMYASYIKSKYPDQD